MRRRKGKWNPGYLIIAIVAGLGGAYVFLTQYGYIKLPAPTAQTTKGQAGYNDEDRRKLEQLIHTGTKND